MNKFFLLFFLLCTCQFMTAQVNQFDNIAFWQGHTNSYLIENNQLQLKASQEGRSAVGKLVNIGDSCIWNLSVEFKFSPSVNNQFCVYFFADTADQDFISEGLYLQVGEVGSEDALNLFVVTKGEHRLIKSLFSGVFSSEGVHEILLVKKHHDYALLVDEQEQFEFYCEVDVSSFKKSYVGVWNRYTKSNVAGFAMHHFYIGTTLVDGFVAESTVYDFEVNNVQITFSRGLAGFQVKDVTLYGVESIDSYLLIKDTLSVTFKERFGSESKQVLTVLFEDPLGNLLSIDCQFWPYDVDPFDVLITEVMSDFSGNTGYLKEGQYVELYNKSTHPVDLKKLCLIVDGDTVLLPAFVLGPSCYVVLMKTKPLAEYYKNVLTVTGWKILSRNKGCLALITNNGLIDEVIYDEQSCDDDFKREGGWSFEAPSIGDYCSFGGSWLYSNSQLGGTPGFDNSFDDEIEHAALRVKIIEYVSNDKISVSFNFKLLPETISQLNIRSDLDVIKVERSSESINKALLFFGEKMEKGKVYSFRLKGVKDCNDELLDENVRYFFGEPEQPEFGDLIINEVLASAVMDGGDYIEVYNNSAKLIDVSQVLVGMYTKAGLLSNTQLLSDKKVMMAPGQYLCFSENVSAVTKVYLSPLQKDELSLLQLESGFNLPSSDGMVGLVNRSGETIDYIAYEDSWHTDMLTDYKGVSLERISFEGVSNSSENWHSASFDVNHGTPGYQNSNSMNENGLKKGLFLLDDYIELNNSGSGVGMRLTYSMKSQGYGLTGILYSPEGILIKVLCENVPLGVSGELSFDQDVFEQLKLPASIYVVVFEAIHSSNKKVNLKQSVSIF